MAGSSAAAARARARRAAPRPDPRCGAATPTVITYRRAVGRGSGCVGLGGGGGGEIISRRTAMAPTREGPRKAAGMGGEGERGGRVSHDGVGVRRARFALPPTHTPAMRTHRRASGRPPPGRPCRTGPVERRGREKEGERESERPALARSLQAQGGGTCVTRASIPHAHSASSSLSLSPSTLTWYATGNRAAFSAFSWSRAGPGVMGAKVMPGGGGGGGGSEGGGGGGGTALPLVPASALVLAGGGGSVGMTPGTVCVSGGLERLLSRHRGVRTVNWSM